MMSGFKFEVYVLNRHLDANVNAFKSDGKTLDVYYSFIEDMVYTATHVTVPADATLSAIHEAITEDMKEKLPL